MRFLLSVLAAALGAIRRRPTRVGERYDGPLTFAANWVDGAKSVEFWDQLDLIGIDAYMPLMTEDRSNPPVEALVEAWKPYQVRMKALAKKWGLPITFTELGYQSRLGTAEAGPESDGEPRREPTRRPCWR